jgi:hypothetical protein
MHTITTVMFLLKVITAKSYIIADTSIFGNCVLHIKRFRDSSTTVDITSIFVQARAQTNNPPMVSIFSANETLCIKPEGRIREGCSLNIIIGFVSSHSELLHRFMYFNPYTYLFRPNSIYILVLDSLRSLHIPISIIQLPTSIFILKFPPFYVRNHTALYSSPSYFYVCLACRVLPQPVTNNKRIRYLTEYSYQEQWKVPYLKLQAVVQYGTGPISWCEQYIWRKWLLPKGDVRRNFMGHCNKPAAFWDLSFRSVHPNFTVSRQTIAKWEPGFTGSFSQKLYMKVKGFSPSPWQVSSNHYAGAEISGIVYCDCKRRSESVSIEMWNVGFGKLEWAVIIWTGAVASIYSYSMGKGTHTYIGETINVLGIVLRQGSNKGFLLALFSLAIYSVSLLFEDSVTSSLVASKKNPPFDLAELISAGYRILITGQTTNEFGSHLPFLQDEFDKFNVTFILSLVRTAYPETVNNPRIFVEDKFSFFFIATETGKDVIQQRIKSKVPEHCVCPLISNTFSQFPVYSFFNHKLTFRIFEIVQRLTEAGLHNFFDWDLQRLAPDFFPNPKVIENAQSVSDSFISLKNLCPILVIFGFLLLFSFLTFSFELRHLVFRKCAAYRFKSKLEKMLLLVVDLL